MTEIYHITHIDNLPEIINNGGLFSDSVMIEKQNAYSDIGIEQIKDRRLRIEVACNPGTNVGDYVPF